MENLSYWEQLEQLRMYSLERRRERYQIIYTWRILEGLVPNLESTPITAVENERRVYVLRHCPIKVRDSSILFPLKFAILKR